MKYLYNRIKKNDLLDCGLLMHLNVNRHFGNNTIDRTSNVYKNMLNFYRTNDRLYGGRVYKDLLFDINMTKLFGTHVHSTIPKFEESKLNMPIMEYFNENTQLDIIKQIKHAIDRKNICMVDIITNDFKQVHGLLITKYKKNKLLCVNIPTVYYKNTHDTFRYCTKYTDTLHQDYKILYAIEIKGE